MSRFNRTTRAARVENLAGGRAYKHAPEMELVISVLTTFLENKFYESGDERLERIKDLVSRVKPEFVAKLAVMARTEFHLRSVTTALIGELARNHRGDNLVFRVMEKAIERPDDLTELVAYLGKPIPKQVKRGIRHALLKFSPYSLAKYRGESKSIKIVDLFNLVHPNPKFASKEQKKAWKELLNGELKNEETWEARLSSGEDKKKVWKEMVSEKTIGYMALLRNLRNMEEQADETTKKKAAQIISSKSEVAKSKQLPFRFYNAYEQISSRLFMDAIAEALEHSLSNVPKLRGRTLVAVDASGSMAGDPIKKASIFAAALVKSNNADLILYDTNVKTARVVTGSPVIMIAGQIQKLAMGGGTDTSLVFQYAAQTGDKYTRIVILSDNESWADYDSPNSEYGRYKTVNDCYVYAIDLAGHGTKDVTGNKVYHLAGWSEKIFDFMKWIEQENDLVKFVENVEI